MGAEGCRNIILTYVHSGLWRYSEQCLGKCSGANGGGGKLQEEQRTEKWFINRAMLCIRGTSHGPDRPSVCLSVRHKSEFY